MRKHNTMKRIVVTAFISISSLSLFAQTGNLGDNPEECKKNLSLYTDYLTQKVYKDAYKFWVEAVKVCPEYNANLYDNGIYIMNKLKKGASAERQKSLSDSIIWAYEQSISLFGDNPKINENYGADMIKMGKISKGVEVMKKSIDSANNGQTRASSIYYYSNALAVLKNKEKMDCEVLVNEYDRLSTIISMNEGQKGYDKAQDAVDKFLGPCLTCDKLLPVIEKKFEQAKTDDNLRSKVLNTLKKRECTDNEMFKTLIVIDVENNPSAEGYEGLAQLYLQEGSNSKAITYYDKAIDMTEDAAKKESMLINTAKILLNKGNRSKAGDYANEALKLNSSNGDAYLIKASIIASSACGTSRFDDQAINWAAYDMAAKAKSLDSSVASQASKDMSRYQARFPEKGDVFAQGLQTGQAYKTCNGYSTTVK